MIRRAHGITGIFLATLLLAAAPAKAAEKTSAQCGREFDQCQETCNAGGADAAQRAPCVAKCSGLYAACDAGVAYDNAKPWLEDQAKKTKKFFENLIDKYKSDEPDPAPQTKTKSNSI